MRELRIPTRKTNQIHNDVPENTTFLLLDQQSGEKKTIYVQLSRRLGHLSSPVIPCTWTLLSTWPPAKSRCPLDLPSSKDQVPWTGLPVKCNYLELDRCHVQE